jgi:hypothetical protein
MELSVELESGIDIRRYKTPLHKLARRWKQSAELWKAKHLEVKATIKRYQNAASDARRSRDCWKEKARQWQQTAEQLQAEVDRLQVEAPVGVDEAGAEKKRVIVLMN